MRFIIAVAMTPCAANAAGRFSRFAFGQASTKAFFQVPLAAEGAFVAQIYGVPHFQQNIEQRKLLRGGRNADPFVIARATSGDRSVVTMEEFKPNGAKNAEYLRTLPHWLPFTEEFMEREGWEF